MREASGSPVSLSDPWYFWAALWLPGDYSLMGQWARGRLAPTQRSCSPLFPAPILSWREGICAWLGRPPPIPPPDLHPFQSSL